MTEFEQALSKYGTAIKHFENDPVYLNLISNFSKIVPFERPDGYLSVENLVYIVEHFEFDSSKVGKKKGSTSRSELSRVNREFEKYPVNSESPYLDELDITPSADSYIKNAIQNMQNHYGKIQDYKSNLQLKDIISENSTVRTGFFIEDVTQLGSYYKGDNGWQPLNLVNCQEFLDNFDNCTDLDFCLCTNSYEINDIYSFFSSPFLGGQLRRSLYFLSKTSIENYRRGQISITEIEYKAFIPRTIGIKDNF